MRKLGNNQKHELDKRSALGFYVFFRYLNLNIENEAVYNVNVLAINTPAS